MTDRAPSGGRESCRFCENAIRYQDGWRLETSSEESSYRCGANRGLHAPKYRAPSGDLSEGGVEAAAKAIIDYEHEWNDDPTCKSVARVALRAAGLPEMEAALRECRDLLKSFRVYLPLAFDEAVGEAIAGAEAALCDKEGGGDG